MQIGDTTCESISKTAQSSASCSDLRASAASGYLCTFPRWVPISEEAQTSSSWRFDAYAGGKRGLACYLARTWIRTLKLRPHSGSETATLGFNLQVALCQNDLPLCARKVCRDRVTVICLRIERDSPYQDSPPLERGVENGKTIRWHCASGVLSSSRFLTRNAGTARAYSLFTSKPYSRSTARQYACLVSEQENAAYRQSGEP